MRVKSHESKNHILFMREREVTESYKSLLHKNRKRTEWEKETEELWSDDGLED